MKIVDRGGGTPVVVVPGVQGRWEWMKPAIETLAQRSHVITFSLADERACGAPFDEQRGFWCYVDQVRDALDQAGVSRAAICGVSYGALIAAAFAARHPERVASLVLVSPMPPSWTPDSRARFYLRAPRLLSPLFALQSLRMYREIAAANATSAARLRAAARHGWNVLTHMFSPARMARRIHLLQGLQLETLLRRVQVPTLVITGDPALDRVVPVKASYEYVRLWPHARVAMIERTGHLGLITRPDEFARLVVSFAEGPARQANGEPWRRVG
jgi:pimeloyl-ACP methyl ester carboxylesterase